MSATPIVIRPVGPDHVPDLRRFFSSAPADVHWRHCACQCFHFTGGMDAWDARTPVQNLDATAALVGAGRMHGVLAYAGADPVGWCHAAPRDTFAWTFGRRGAPAPQETKLGAIVCFVVTPAWRGRGVARQLLRGACDHLRTLGCSAVEAYPVREPGPDSDGMEGPLALYLAEGFTAGEALGTRVRVSRTLVEA